MKEKGQIWSYLRYQFALCAGASHVFICAHAFVCLTRCPAWRLELSLSLYSFFLLPSSQWLGGDAVVLRQGLIGRGLVVTHTHIQNAFMPPYKVVWWANGSTTGSVTVKQGLWFPCEQLRDSACLKDRNHGYSRKNTLQKKDCFNQKFSIQSIPEGQNTFYS